LGPFAFPQRAFLGAGLATVFLMTVQCFQVPVIRVAIRSSPLRLVSGSKAGFAAQPHPFSHRLPWHHADCKLFPADFEAWPNLSAWSLPFRVWFDFPLFGFQGSFRRFRLDRLRPSH
jgi:hypothetical protein